MLMSAPKQAITSAFLLKKCFSTVGVTQTALKLAQMMRAALLSVLLALAMMPLNWAHAQKRVVGEEAWPQSPPSEMAPELVCPKPDLVSKAKAKRPSHPAQKTLAPQQQGGLSSSSANQAEVVEPLDPLVIPDPESVQEALAPLPPLSSFSSSSSSKLLPWFKPWDGRSVYRVGIWGDSHIAANFFSDQLRLLSGLAPQQITVQWLPAAFGRAGVRFPIQKVCVSGNWRYEVANARLDPGMPHALGGTGPGLISMTGSGPNSQVALDLRPPKSGMGGFGNRMGVPNLRIHYSIQEPVEIALKVNGEAAQVMSLDPASHSVDVQGATWQQPQRLIQTVSLSLVRGALTLQGIEVPVEVPNQLVLDTFGIPGSVASSWKGASSQDWQTWWDAPGGYDTVILAYGTNEGNQFPFDALRYETDLKQALTVMREQFPQAACILVAPGDRGVLVRQSTLMMKRSKRLKTSKKMYSKRHLSAPFVAKATSVDLLKYARIHQQIGLIQERIAGAYQCQVWQAQSAMGGLGSSYGWSRKQPAWMAQDLIHFTPLGYRELANRFSKDTQWDALFQLAIPVKSVTSP